MISQILIIKALTALIPSQWKEFLKLSNNLYFPSIEDSNMGMGEVQGMASNLSKLWNLKMAVDFKNEKLGA